MEKVRFEVTLNGKHLCTAGVDGYGVLMVTMVMATLLNADVPGAEMTAQPLYYDLELSVGGLECNGSTDNKNLIWVHRSLKEGDEVRVRVLPDGEHDPPISLFSDHASSCVKEQDGADTLESYGLPIDDSPQGGDTPGNVRFSCLLNGTPLCVAGLDGAGLIGTHIVAVTRHPNYARDFHVDGMCAEDFLNLTVRGLDDEEKDCRANLTWINRQTLSQGDEIHIRLLPPGDYDAPKRLSSARRKE